MNTIRTGDGKLDAVMSRITARAYTTLSPADREDFTAEAAAFLLEAMANEPELWRKNTIAWWTSRTAFRVSNAFRKEWREEIRIAFSLDEPFSQDSDNCFGDHVPDNCDILEEFAQRAREIQLASKIAGIARDLKPTELAVLAALADAVSGSHDDLLFSGGGINQRAICNHIGAKPSTVSRVMSALRSQFADLRDHEESFAW